MGHVYYVHTMHTTVTNKLAHYLTLLSCHDCPCSLKQIQWLVRTTALIGCLLSFPADIGQMYMYVHTHIVHVYMYIHYRYMYTACMYCIKADS